MADEERSFAPDTISSNRARKPNLGAGEDPREDWGEESAPDALFSADHARRPIRTEAERGQGAKTRRLNKDIVSRRV